MFDLQLRQPRYRVFPAQFFTFGSVVPRQQFLENSDLRAGAPVRVMIGLDSGKTPDFEHISKVIDYEPDENLGLITVWKDGSADIFLGLPEKEFAEFIDASKIFGPDIAVELNCPLTDFVDYEGRLRKALVDTAPVITVLADRG